MTCSAFSFGSASSSASSAASRGGIGAARPRARDRPQLRVAAMALDQRLGRGAHHRDIAQLAEKHVRRRIEQPQRAIHLERRQRMAALEARREHQLIDVAGGDVFLRAPHALRVRRFGQRRRRRRKAPRRRVMRRAPRRAAPG